MTKLASVTGTVQALLLAVAVVGCATAACITGHISGSDFLAVLGGVGFAGGTVTTAHVVGSQVNTAAAGPAPVTSPGADGGAGTGATAPAQAIPAGPAPVQVV